MDAELARAALRDYFNLDTASLVNLYQEFSKADARFRAVGPYFAGTRMLRQDPVECLFSFICSSNNNIKRIALIMGRIRVLLRAKAVAPVLGGSSSIGASSTLSL